MRKKDSKPRPDAEPIMGIDRREYTVDSAINDGESVILVVERAPAFYFNFRMSPRVAKRLALDLTKVALASDEWIARKKSKAGAR
jgi:hypothetical protein